MRKIVKLLIRVEEGFLGYTLLVMVFFCFAQVILRYVFSHSIGWMEEVLRYLMILMTFTGVGLGVKYGTHFAVESIFNCISDRYCHTLKALTDLMCFSWSGLFLYLSWLFVMKSKLISQTSPTLLVPMYIIYLIIPLGCFSMSIRFLINFFRDLAGLVKGKEFVKKS